MLYAFGCWPWLYIGRGYIVLEHSTHLVWTRRSSHHAADVIVLWITYSVNIDRQAGRCIQFLVTEKIVFSKTSSWGLKTETNKTNKIGGGASYMVIIDPNSYEKLTESEIW